MVGSILSIPSLKDVWIPKGLNILIDRKLLEEVYGRDYYFSEIYEAQFIFEDIKNKLKDEPTTKELTNLQPELRKVPYDVNNYSYIIQMEKGFRVFKFIEVLFP